MEFAPPPAPGSRVRELGGRLIVSFQPRRSWAELAFLAFWLAGWTVGGIAAFIAVLHEAWPARVGLALWLCLWAFGEAAVVVIAAWQLFGRQLLIVTPGHLEVRDEIGRFARVRRYDVALVSGISAARVPNDEDEPPRKDFCLRISYGGKTLAVGEGMGEREAEHVAALVSARIGLRARRSDQPSSAPDRFKEAEAAERRLRKIAALLLVAFFLAVIGVAAVVDIEPAQDEPPAHRDQRDVFGEPSPEDFSNPSAYAAAVSVSALSKIRVRVVGSPDCNDDATWTAWECIVTVRPPPEFIQTTFKYRCAPSSRKQRGGATVFGVSCVPEARPLLPATDPS